MVTFSAAIAFCTSALCSGDRAVGGLYLVLACAADAVSVSSRLVIQTRRRVISWLLLPFNDLELLRNSLLPIRRTWQLLAKPAGRSRESRSCDLPGVHLFPQA